MHPWRFFDLFVESIKLRVLLKGGIVDWLQPLMTLRGRSKLPCLKS